MLVTKRRKSYLAVVSALGMVSGTFSYSAFAQEKTLDEDGFEQIIVTASRTTSVASKTPVALASVGAEDLRNAGVTNPTTLGDVTPNLSIDRNNGLQITIRGVSSSDNTEKGDPSAAFLLDGVYIARPQAQEVSFFDVSRVEVLRGPQGTLYGRNTTAGVVNIITNKPIFDYESSIDMAYGSYNALQGTAMVNLPVNDDFALRFAANIDRRDNYLETDGVDADVDTYKDNRSLRATGLYNISDDVEVLVRLDYSDMLGNPNESALLTNFYDMPDETGIDPTYIDNSSKALRQFGYDTIGKQDRDNSTWGVEGDVNWYITPELTLNYLGSYREFTRDEEGSRVVGQFTADNSVKSVRYTWDGEYEQHSEELRLAYDNGQLQAQAGLYYFREESGIAFILYGLLADEGEDGYIFGFPQDPTISQSVAAFGQATYHLTDDLRVTAGIRSTKDEKSRFGATIRHTTLDEEYDFENGDTLNYADREFSKVTWKLGLDYDLDSRTLVYGSVATGYKAGGFNGGCLEGVEGCTSPTTEEALYYNPETLVAFEAGLKTRFPEYKLQLNTSAFHYDYEDLQLSGVVDVDGAPLNVTTNAAEADVDGVEIETVWTPTADDKLNLALTWLDARYASYQMSETASFDGDPLSRSPKFSLTAGYKHTWELSSGATVDFGLNTKWSSEYYILNNTIEAYFRQPGYTKTDVTLTYYSQDTSWYAQVFAKNLEDNVTVSSVSVASSFPTLTGGTATFSDPRTFGIRAGYRY
ncbi:TonB-dependent receptor [Alteromonas sp. 14N.309.X.WAT.G.H12]|uniref:TonB-dependent receptor n=1 Tax=Alteromonas sp. 14N.309.X.WAT.G.H12 TaxID=3120824 RepID=UPI002FD11A44